MHVNTLRFALYAGVAFAVASPASADITGTINATITLEAGCIINSQNLDDGASAADFGTLDFGLHNTLFVQADAQVVNGAAGIQVQCSPGIAPVLSFNAGQNDGEGAGTGLRAMAHETAANQFVTYNLYSDAGYSTVIPIGGDLTLASTGALQTVNVYGRAFGESGLVTGAYADEITITLEL